MLVRDCDLVVAPLQGLEDLWIRLPGPSLVGLAPAQAIISQAFGPEKPADKSTEDLTAESEEESAA